MVDAGDIGEIQRVHVNTYPWMSQLGTHYMDYALWISGATGAKWAVGHVHGKQKLSDHHPSPDFVNGVALLDNEVRLYFECGYLSPRNLPETSFWVDDRLTVYGSKGYVWAECNGRWSAFTSKTGGEVITGHQLDEISDDSWNNGSERSRYSPGWSPSTSIESWMP
jgi:predicted dehydrogenase